MTEKQELLTQIDKLKARNIQLEQVLQGILITVNKNPEGLEGEDMLNVIGEAIEEVQ